MKTTTTTKTKTRKIAGQRVTLVLGIRYMASRPFAARGRTEYPVTIEPMNASPDESHVRTITVAGLSYEQANALINAFNNGEMSFDGRVW